MNSNRLSCWFALFFIGIGVSISFIAKRWTTTKNKGKVSTIVVYVTAFLTVATLGLICSLIGVDLTEIGRGNRNYGTSTYTVFMLILPLMLIVFLKLYSKRFSKGAPKSGVWYCEALQIQLCFDEKEKSFIIKAQEKIMCSIEFRGENDYLYLISNDPLDGCVFSGRFISRTKKQLCIENRDSQEICTFILRTE